MRGVTFFVILVAAILLSGTAYIGYLSRQSAMAEVSKAQTRADVLDREVEETARIVSGQRR